MITLTTLAFSAALHMGDLPVMQDTALAQSTPATVIQVAGKKGGFPKRGQLKRDFNGAAKPTLKGTFNGKAGNNVPTPPRPGGPIWKPPGI